MKYFVLNQNKQVVEINDYLKQPGIDSEFARFIRREALGEILVEQSNDKPSYLRYANKLGFRWEPNADIGHVQYDYKANLMRRLVQDYARQLVHEIGMPVYEVNGANMFSLNHPVVDAYRSAAAMPYDAPATALAAALYAARPKENYFQLSAPEGRHRRLIADPAQKDRILKTYVELVSAKPVQRVPRRRKT